ncbi:helix-turn-helix domain-containing protein [Trinickia dinghuensis]|uniref:helix-turn-helix domain-containing protein n=1 Tax=Trinickia dinghuensis TaxID=2291023 RepID=UPI0015F166AA|nr:AraC family transcriptional regulator [Trinickia dinghuensis]
MYLPLLSSLGASNLPGGSKADSRIATYVNEADLALAMQHAHWLIEKTGAAPTEAASLPALLQSLADLEAACGDAAEAEALYRSAQKKFAGSKLEMRALSCRNAGWQALLRFRPGVALLCFMRLVDEAEVTAAWRLEGHCGLGLALLALGDATQALAVLDELDEILESEHGVTDHAAWREIATLLRFDFAVQHELRTNARLDDHVYWKTPALEERSLNQGDPHSAAQRAQQAARTVPMPLLAQRFGYLCALRQVIAGDREALADINDHLDWAHHNGLADYMRTTRIEVALALIAAGCEDVAERVLEPLQRGTRQQGATLSELDRTYCAAKTCTARGRHQEALALYRRHASIASRSLRQEAHPSVTFASRPARRRPQLDDLGARLPARYRRAYAFMQANLDRKDLSVHEIAAEIGVTERALQNAFRTFLGLSPREVIRRERMERIRAELVAADRGVMHTARKWGVHSRSALVAGYRKQFNEVPTDTIER